MKLIIGNKNYSSWSLRPWLLLSVHRLPFEEIRIPLYRDDTHEALSAYTDAGKVPVLHDGKLVVWDSLAICEYVSERYLDGRGWPEDLSARAEARSWCAEMHSGFVDIRNSYPMNCRASGRHVETTPGLEAEVARIDAMWSGARRRYQEQGHWLFGDFSIVDCMFAPVVSRFHTYGVPVSGPCAAYMEHVLAHEAMLRWYQESLGEREVLEMSEVGVAR